MTHIEPRVGFADLRSPVIITRDLRVASGNKGVEPVHVTALKVVVVVNRCVYIVADPGDTNLKVGEVLMRNLDYTRKYGGSRGDSATEVFVRYDNINNAIRGNENALFQLNQNELPALNSWRLSLRELMRSSWTLGDAAQGEIETHALLAEDVVDEHSGVRNPEKVIALAKTIQASIARDRRGQHNPGRIPLIVLSGDRCLNERVTSILSMSYRLMWRGLTLRKYRNHMRDITTELEDSVAHLLTTTLAAGPARSTHSIRREIGCMVSGAETIRTYLGRPFSNLLAHSANDLDAIAVHLHQVDSLVVGGRADAAEELIQQLVLPLVRIIYRACKHQRIHQWPIEDMMIRTSIVKRNPNDVRGSELRGWELELMGVRRSLKELDPITGEEWDKRFVQNIVAGVVTNLNIAIRHLTKPTSEGGPNFHGMHERLKIVSSTS